MKKTKRLAAGLPLLSWMFLVLAMAGLLAYTLFSAHYAGWRQSLACPAKCTKGYRKGAGRAWKAKWMIVNPVRSRRQPGQSARLNPSSSPSRCTQEWTARLRLSGTPTARSSTKSMPFSGTCLSPTTFTRCSSLAGIYGDAPRCLRPARSATARWALNTPQKTGLDSANWCREFCCCFRCWHFSIRMRSTPRTTGRGVRRRCFCEPIASRAP
ncbi:hypothetical protein N657DRAFT_120187 [Parathielavia appendiculata]|uniref:Uncharacterized protein n=1 Tax=Parathielavia appendiculata TaxID=2587402 RepID=A0AAN6Z239_9PEZI|nr:hypothetical protein N657DRAFT_120187 [Parathielavia appendiculata]